MRNVVGEKKKVEQGAAKIDRFNEQSPLHASKTRFTNAKSKSPKRASSKTKTKPAGQKVKRIQALTDNVKMKNLQITDLNRQMKVMFESNQR